MILNIILVHWTTDNNYYYYYRNKSNKCCSILSSFKVFSSSMMSWSVCASIQFISRIGQEKNYVKITTMATREYIFLALFQSHSLFAPLIHEWPIFIFASFFVHVSIFRWWMLSIHFAVDLFSVCLFVCLRIFFEGDKYRNNKADVTAAEFFLASIKKKCSQQFVRIRNDHIDNNNNRENYNKKMVSS